MTFWDGFWFGSNFVAAFLSTPVPLRIANFVMAIVVLVVAYKMPSRER